MGHHDLPSQFSLRPEVTQVELYNVTRFKVSEKRKKKKKNKKNKKKQQNKTKKKQKKKKKKTKKPKFLDMF